MLILDVMKAMLALFLALAGYGILYLISPFLAIAVFVVGTVLVIAEDNSAGNSTENSER